MDKKRKRELKKLREELAQQQQLLANQNLHQTMSRETQSDDEGMHIPRHKELRIVFKAGQG